MLTSAFTGFATGLSLIVAIGAQNAYVLRQGLARDHVAVVVAICALSDAVLIAAGVGGVGALVALHPTVLTLLKFAGAAYLLWFGVRSLLAARHPSALGPVVLSGARSVVATTLALTFLNPHVYLDTVLMLGNIANQQGSQGRWWFAGGAALASVVWFCSIGYGAAASARWLVRPRTWQVLDVLIGITMIVIAVVLVTS
ncbi:LysE/ArgO family amino acid transporter [Allobranchiibius sp. GilTou73]|uniref:LysE/ArgO family amino acid transporter n=1 Tax=Allobranchiibius sp. GilTou73 TaxID=2904523 RepID=UPI001F459BED|nr:LysE/ArgO family amino acid transporter [Allobranchiibius sp. GilTou73]UIJ35708.1 LysE/ArgO family amino acid transporter [Allobranchiibius sp. GilTou73]